MDELRGEFHSLGSHNLSFCQNNAVVSTGIQVRGHQQVIYQKRPIISRDLYTFYPLFEVHLCTVTFGLMYGLYSRAASNQEQLMMARVQ